MKTLYITQNVQLSRDENTLRVDLPNGEFRRFPIESIEHIVLLRSETITTKTLELCGQAGVRVSVFNMYGVFRGCFEPKDKSPSGLVVLRQAEAILNSDVRLMVAKQFVMGSGWNAINLLKKAAHADNAQYPEALKKAIVELDGLVNRCNAAVSVPDLMGREGQWRARYYESWGSLDERLKMGPRIRRPPNNRINCLVSFFNQLLYANVAHQLAKTHLHAALSFLHSPGQSRASLALDVAEIFRPPLVDRLIFRLVRKNQLQDAWFDEKDGVCLFNEAGMKSILNVWREETQEEAGEGSWSNKMHQEVLALERYLLGMSKNYRPYLYRQ